MPPDEDAAQRLASNDVQLIEATRLAWRWHGHQTRKGKTTSYLSHLLQVQGLVIEHSGDDAQAIAALLHDALEDATTPSDRAERERIIRASFAPSVLRIVLDCTDTTPEEAGADKGPWRVRKERYIAQLEVADRESLLVAACDKRHNLGDLIADLREEGLATFSRFNAGAEDQLWYFETLEALFAPKIPVRLADELARAVASLRAFVETGEDETAP